MSADEVGLFLLAAAFSLIKRDKLPVIALISSTFCFHSALLTAVSFAHASTKRMQLGSDCAMTACLSFKGYGANKCPRDVMTKQVRMSVPFLCFSFWFL